MSRAAHYGMPRIRVRMIGADRGLLRRKMVYEVEFTPVGADSPTWTSQTRDPVGLISPELGVGDAHAVVDAAGQAPAGQWRSLFDADE